jgi:hypothetical protein
MRRTSVALIAALGTVGVAAHEVAAVENCRTGDSAICASDPNCNWDYERRGCYEGAPTHEDACAAHSDQTICATDLTIGCKWNGETSKCESAK